MLFLKNKYICKLEVGDLKYSRHLLTVVVVMYISSDNINCAMIFAELFFASILVKNNSYTKKIEKKNIMADRTIEAHLKEISLSCETIQKVHSVHFVYALLMASAKRTLIYFDLQVWLLIVCVSCSSVLDAVRLSGLLTFSSHHICRFKY